MKLHINKYCYFLISTKNKPTPDDALNPTMTTYNFLGTKLNACWLSPMIELEIVKNIFDLAIQHKIPLHSSIKPYHFGHQWNIAHYYSCNGGNNSDDDIFYEGNHWLFSNNTLQTWIYNVDNKIIMEIAPSYPWSDVEPKEGEIIYSFEAFMQNYKPVAIHEISIKTAQKWIKQAEDYMNIVEAQYPEWCEKNKDNLFYLKHDA